MLPQTAAPANSTTEGVGETEVHTSRNPAVWSDLLSGFRAFAQRRAVPVHVDPREGEHQEAGRSREEQVRAGSLPAVGKRKSCRSAATLENLADALGKLNGLRAGSGFRA